MSQQPSVQEINHGLDYLNQLGALYGIAILPDGLYPDVSLKEPAHAVVEDLGNMFLIAEHSIRAMRDYDALLAKGEGPIAASTEALKRLHERLTNWTSFSRWVRVLIAAERRWQKNLDFLAPAVSKNREMVDVLRAASEERESFLEDVKKSLSNIHAERNAAYAIPMPL